MWNNTCEVWGWCHWLIIASGFVTVQGRSLFYCTVAVGCSLWPAPHEMCVLHVCAFALIACFRDPSLDVDEPFSDVGVNRLLLHLLPLLWRNHLVRKNSISYFLFFYKAKKIQFEPSSLCLLSLIMSSLICSHANRTALVLFVVCFTC